jgi:hypothetical protein
MYNYAPSMYSITALKTISGVTPVSSGIVSLSTDATVTVASGKYYGIEIQSDLFNLCKEVRLYVGDPSAYHAGVVYTTLSGQGFSAHGSVNVNTGYCTPAMTDYIKFTDATSSGIYNLLTPKMTGPTTPSPCKVTGDYLSTWYPWQAFDRTYLNTGDTWAAGLPSTGNPKRIMFSFGAGNAKTVTHYRIQCGDAINEFPRDWTLQGTSDPYAAYSDATTSSKWTNLDTRTGVYIYNVQEWSDIFTIASPRLFTAYRFVVTANNGSSSYVEFSECRFYSSDQSIKSNTLGMVLPNSEYTPDAIQAWKAFSQSNVDASDCWASRYLPSTGSPKILAVYVGNQGKVINKYALLSRNHSGGINDRAFPRDWTLWGSNSDNPGVVIDTEWTLLDTRVSVGDPGQNVWTSYFTFDNALSFRWYKIKITNRNGTYDHTAVAELKLVETSYALRYPVLNTASGTMSHDVSGYYVYSFDDPLPLYSVKVFYGNKSSTVQTVSGLQLLGEGSSIICLSGAITPLRFSFQDQPPSYFTITSAFSGSVIPRLQPTYTGVYDVDRNIFFAPSGSADWVGLDSTAYAFPEHYGWDLGTSSGVESYRTSLRLSSTSYSGTWTSPIFDWGRDLGFFYVYSTGYTGPQIEVRTSETPPPRATFLVATTENTHQNLMYKHKRIVIDSKGNALSSVECNSPNTGNKLWRHADYTFAGTPLNYRGAVNNNGTAAFLCPGITTCGDMDPEEAIADQSLWYNLCNCKITDTSKWNMGTMVSGLDWGPRVMVLYTKVFPMEREDSFFVTSITSRSMAEDWDAQRIKINIGFQDGDTTRFTMPVVTLHQQRLLASDTYEIIADVANNAWWAYLGGSIGKIYKFDVGSLNCVRVFGGSQDTTQTPTPRALDEYLGYSYVMDFDGAYKHLVEVPTPDFCGFWAFTTSGINLFEEYYEGASPAIRNRGEILNSNFNTNYFQELHQGACDYTGNLWVVDLAQERLIRVNIQEVLSQGENQVDYDNAVDGILAVSPQQTGDIAYILTSNEIDHPEQDVIRMVHAGQSVGARGKYLCTVSGFYSAPYSYGVDFHSLSYTDYYLPYPSDTTWGRTGSWMPLTNGSALPQGRFKQFRLTLSRPSVEKTSPILERIRIPQPMILPSREKKSSITIAVKTLLSRCKSYGLFNIKSLIYWTDEEYKG